MNQQYLKSVVSYDSETGVFRWISPRPGAKVGTAIAHKSMKGYVFAVIDRRTYQCHRLAWLYVYGVWPPHHIDHINGVKNDNRICNLRLATPSQNQQNRPKPSSNTSGFKGVAWHNGAQKWQVYITVNKKRVHLGLFADKDMARLAYDDAAKRFFGEFANL